MALTTVNAQMVSGAITTSSTGNVSIGSTTVSSNLSVYGAGSGTFSPYNDPLVVQGSDYSLLYVKGTNGISASVYSYNASNGWYTGTNNSAAYRIGYMSTINGTGITNAKDGSAGITVTTGNNIGIGTASPSFLLQAQGQINFASVNAGVTGQGAGFNDGGTLFLGSDFQNPNSMSGTTNANYKFSTNRTGCVAASNPSGYIYEGFTSASGSRCFAVLSSGNVQNTNNSYGSLSDATIKQDIVDAASQWDDVKNLRVRKYRFIEEVEQNPEAKPQIGLVAQEAELVSAGLVDKQIIYKQKLDVDGNPIPDSYGVPEMEVDKELKTIKYSVLYMKAFKALQEAMERIEKLEAEVAAMKAAP